MGRQITEQRILDASECLFARKGHDASIRAISDMAGVNIAAINYYFGTKENLIGAVFDRRLAKLNEACSGRLRSLCGAGMKENHTFSVSRILRVFLEPFFRSKDVDLMNIEYVALIGRIMIASDGVIQGAFFSAMTPSLELLLKLLCEALPGAPEHIIRLRLLLSMGTVGCAMCMIGVSSLLHDGSSLSDPDLLIDGLASFLGSALESPAENPSTPRERPRESGIS
ncbi:MAG: TetR/AcrR family transcriptional regulator [Methylobacter sp.]